MSEVIKASSISSSANSSIVDLPATAFVILLVLQKGDEFIWLENYKYARYALLFSASLSVYTIFQFRKRSRQILLSSFSRLLITLSLILIILEIKGEEMKFAYGLFLLLIPYLTLFLAGYFVKKDEKLVKSADRIR